MMSETGPIQVKLYVLRNGKIPFEIWLGSLKDIKTRARIKVRIDRLSLGNWGDCKALGSSLYELRADFGPGYRVYFGRIAQSFILLLCGGDKKTQHADIQRAKEYWDDFQQREKEGENE